MIKKDLAYSFMNKKKNSSVQETPKNMPQRVKVTGTEALISKINKTTPIQNSKTHVENVRKSEEGFTFDVLITKNNTIIKDVFLPADKIYSRKTQEAKEHSKRLKARQRKTIEFIIIYPAAIVSIMTIIHGFMTILPKLQNIFR